MSTNSQLFGSLREKWLSYSQSNSAQVPINQKVTQTALDLS